MLKNFKFNKKIEDTTELIDRILNNKKDMNYDLDGDSESSNDETKIKKVLLMISSDHQLEQNALCIMSSYLLMYQKFDLPGTLKLLKRQTGYQLDDDTKSKMRLYRFYLKEKNKLCIQLQ